MWDRQDAAVGEMIACAFVGAFAPPGNNLTNPAFSPAGHLFQERLLASLNDAEIEISQVFSLRTVVSYPRGDRVWYPAARGDIGGRFPATLIPFVNLGALKPITAGLALFPRLLAWVWKHRHRPRVILQYNVTSPPGIVSIVAGRLTRTKVCAVVADINVPGAGPVASNRLRRIEYWLQAYSLPRFDGLVVLTRRIAQDFAPNTPHILMEGGAPDPHPAHGGTASFPQRQDSDPFVVMYSGRLVALKGVPLLLSAFSRLEGHRYRLWISGDGPLRGDVERAAARDRRIRYFGLLPVHEMRERYRQATVFVNPHSAKLRSARYVFPSKLIEYLATGKPVITTCSTPEVEEEYASVSFVLTEEDPAELAGMIRRLAQMPQVQLDAMGERGRAFILGQKSWGVQGRRIAVFLKALVDRRAVPPDGWAVSDSHG
jgi:glycosyltransferase involved in cell wall biosynthesis